MERLTEKDNISSFQYSLKRKSNPKEFIDYDAFYDYSMAVKRLGELEDANESKPINDWHEDDGDCLWWYFPIVEPPYCGSPLDLDFPDYVTHFTKIISPILIEND